MWPVVLSGKITYDAVIQDNYYSALSSSRIGSLPYRLMDYNSVAYRVNLRKYFFSFPKRYDFQAREPPPQTYLQTAYQHLTTAALLLFAFSVSIFAWDFRQVRAAVSGNIKMTHLSLISTLDFQMRSRDAQRGRCRRQVLLRPYL
jgi:hypothetical protein